MLRENVMRGLYEYNKLVTLSATELATEEQRIEREKVKNEDDDARRLDWLEENKAQIQLENGIDPSNVWEYERGDDQLSEPDADPPDI